MTLLPDLILIRLIPIWLPKFESCHQCDLMNSATRGLCWLIKTVISVIPDPIKVNGKLQFSTRILSGKMLTFENLVTRQMITRRSLGENEKNQDIYQAIIDIKLSYVLRYCGNSVLVSLFNSISTFILDLMPKPFSLKNNSGTIAEV